MIIRDLKKSDLPELLRMIRALSAFHDDVAAVTLDDLQRDCMGPAPLVHVFVAFHQGMAVGYAALVPRVRFHDGVRNMDVHHLFVDQKMRGQGVGRALLDAAKVEAQRRGCEKMLIGTHPENVTAQEIYQHYGFERYEKTDPAFRLSLV